MRTLGAILAGGRSSRFGSDKASALLRGRSLLDHAIGSITSHCDVVAVVGRAGEGLLFLEDKPRPGLGPLGGIAAALDYAAQNGFGQVLTAPVDCLFLPRHIRRQLEPAPAYLDNQPVVGLWPASAGAELAQMIHSGEKLAVRAFAARVGARAIKLATTSPNINTPADLEVAAEALWGGT